MTCDSGTLDLNSGLTHVKKLIFLNNSTRSQRLKKIRDMKWNYKVGGRGKSQPAEFPNKSQRPNSTGFRPAHTLESVLAFFCSFFDDFLLFVDRFDDFLLFSVEGEIVVSSCVGQPAKFGNCNRRNGLSRIGCEIIQV